MNGRVWCGLYVVMIVGLYGVMNCNILSTLCNLCVLICQGLYLRDDEMLESVRERKEPV